MNRPTDEYGVATTGATATVSRKMEKQEKKELNPIEDHKVKNEQDDTSDDEDSEHHEKSDENKMNSYGGLVNTDSEEEDEDGDYCDECGKYVAIDDVCLCVKEMIQKARKEERKAERRIEKESEDEEESDEEEDSEEDDDYGGYCTECKEQYDAGELCQCQRDSIREARMEEREEQRRFDREIGKLNNNYIVWVTPKKKKLRLATCSGKRV